LLFNSLAFVAFFAVVYPLYRALPHRGQNRLLLVASWFFYGWWDVRFLGLLLFTTVVDWAIGLRIEGTSEPAARRRWLITSVVVNLGVLATFKYFGFFAHELEVALQGLGLPLVVPFPELVLPVGLSFYTFQSMAYTIDVYRRDVPAVRRLADFALFVSFFPQLVAGPIERARDLIPQLQAPRRVDRDRMAEGTWLILWGFFKKLFVADNAATLVTRVFDDPAPSAGLVLLGAYAFCWQIYGDFSGYSDIARGLGKWMGIELSVNFRTPFFASSPRDLWRRWHITLSQWLRDYLYIPLGGNRGGRARTTAALVTTMALGGLWHGANWTYLVWGLYHGAALALQRMLPPLPSSRIVRAVAIVAMFHFTALGFLVFRAASMTQAWTMLGAFLRPTTPGDAEAILLGQLVVIVAPLLLVDAVQYLRGEEGWMFRLPRPAQAVLSAAVFLAVVFLGASFESQFIYFQF
jgi:alginate O-acetyltransferase complex protein AlgI